MPTMLKAAPTLIPQAPKPTCQMKRGLQDDRRAPLALAYASVDTSTARPDLGQQQRPVGKHCGSAEVEGAAGGGGDKVLIERSSPRACVEGNVMGPYLTKAKDIRRYRPGAGQRGEGRHAVLVCVCACVCVHVYVFSHSCVYAAVPSTTRDLAFGVARGAARFKWDSEEIDSVQL